MKKIAQDYIDFLENEGYSETFPQASARVLFNAQHGKIQDLIVEDFSNPDEKQYLYKKYSFDVGNCDSDWKDWNFSDILIKIFVSYHVPYNIRKKILFEFSRVEEWRPQIAFWIWRNWSDQA